MRETTAPQYLVFTLAASTVLLVLGSVVFGLLAGFALGASCAVNFLRAADSAAAQYHRALIARVLDASSTVHHEIEGIVQQTRWRIDDLRRQLKQLKETKP